MKVLLISLSVLILTACDYVPTEVFEIKTVDGNIIKSACPVVDAGRSELTYLTDGHCVVWE